MDKESPGLDYFASCVDWAKSHKLVTEVPDGFRLYSIKEGEDPVDMDYQIHFGRIDTEEKLLAWILHLSEKTWCTPQLIAQLICRWETHFAKKINRSA